MGKVLLVGRLAARDLRHRPAQAVLLLLAITAATATLTLGLALHGVTSQPYQQTRAATNGPDVVAQLPVLHQPGRQPQPPPQATALIRAPGVTGHSGPYPLVGALVRAGKLTAGAEAEGRQESPAAVDQPKLTAGTWVRPGGVVLERTFAEALGVGVGDRITLNGRPFTVAGTAVTAASPPYPNLCYSSGGGCSAGPQDASATDVGLLWLTEPDAGSLATSANPVASYILNLKLNNPATRAGVRQPVRQQRQPGRAVTGLMAGDRRRGRPAGDRRAAGPVARCLAGRAAGPGHRGGAGRRPDGGADPAGRAAQGGRRHAGAGHRGAAGREPGRGAGRGGGRAGHRMAGRPADHQSRRRPGRHPRRAVAHPVHRRAGRDRRARGGTGRDRWCPRSAPPAPARSARWPTRPARRGAAPG